MTFSQAKFLIYRNIDTLILNLCFNFLEREMMKNFVIFLFIIVMFGNGFIKAEDKAEVYSNRGWSYLKKGEYDRAVANFRKALAIDGKFLEAHCGLANTYRRKGKNYSIKKALAEYSKAIQINPKYAYAYFERGDLYQDREEFEKSLADYKKALEINPKYAIVYFARGRLYYSLKKYGLAIRDFGSAINLGLSKKEKNKIIIWIEKSIQKLK